MCGIVGVASLKSQTDYKWVKKACGVLRHRGPDGTGVWVSGDSKVVLGHRRLSILELSDLGTQPMHDNCRALSITYNGELYNHSSLKHTLQGLGYHFRSNCDTEVLLASYAEWGMECLEQFNGMFAFAIYDHDKRKLFVARDRVGEKPFFYFNDGSSLYFASELKGLLENRKLPRQLDAGSVDCYFAMGFVPGERCILRGYKKLPAAHALTFDLESATVKQWCYWKPPNAICQANAKSESCLVDELDTLLCDAVGQQLVADVHVGVLLSGGVDSSLVTAMAARHRDRIATFSIGFPGQVKFDETIYARSVSNFFGTTHTELMLDPDIIGVVPEIINQFDEPMVDSSMIPTWLISRLVKDQCSVALGGDGADELFGGYQHYKRLIFLENIAHYIPLPFRKMISGMVGDALPTGLKGSNYLRALGVDFKTELPFLTRLFKPDVRSALFDDKIEFFDRAETYRTLSMPQERDTIQRALRFDFKNYLTEDLLVKIDRASMHNSLEMRSPFLDRKLMDFAFSKVPTNLKVTVTERKILLKRLAKRILPPDFDAERKQGFSIPIKSWLASGPFREFFREVLLSDDCVFNKSIIQKLLFEQERGLNNGERLFALVQFESWRKSYGISI